MANELRSFALQVQADPALATKIQTDPVGELMRQALSSAAPAFIGDRFIYRVVVIALAVVVVAVTLGGLYLAQAASKTVELPSAVVALGSAAIGALAGLLAPSPIRGEK